MPQPDSNLTQILMFVLGMAVAFSNLIAWLNRQQLAQIKLESQAQLAAMELRLSEKISHAYVDWQAHNDLAARVERLERDTSAWRNHPPEPRSPHA